MRVSTRGRVVGAVLLLVGVALAATTVIATRAVAAHALVAQADAGSTTALLVAVAAGALVAVGGAGWVVVGRLLAPIRLVRTSAERFGESDLRRRLPVTGGDDVAGLAVAFNGMLDRLEGTVAAQRSFLDDAGHELRTPLTILRGHLEVVGDEPTDAEATRALLLDEVRRMTRIVDDLLLLARAERPDFLTPGAVEVAALTVEAAAKARMLADRAWGVERVADVTVTADGQRLTQALLQLAANAVAHTGPGDRVTLGSELVGDRLRLWVRDTGPGFPEGAPEAAFDRFVRCGAPGDEDGAGLGLAIVRSIARAHDGDALLEPGGPGACVVLDLPARVLDTAPARPPDGGPGVGPAPGAGPGSDPGPGPGSGTAPMVSGGEPGGRTLAGGETAGVGASVPGGETR